MKCTNAKLYTIMIRAIDLQSAIAKLATMSIVVIKTLTSGFTFAFTRCLCVGEYCFRLTPCLSTYVALKCLDNFNL